MPNSRQCKYPECLKFFTPKRKSQVYCQTSCKKADYDIIYFHKIEVFKVCPNCGKDFSTSKPLIQVFCVPECREDAHTKRLYHKPLEYLDKAIESMNEFFANHPVSGEAKSKVLAKYYSHNLEYTPADIHQHTNGSCELCGSSSRTEPYKEIDLCARCHIFAEYMDSDLYERFQKILEQKGTRQTLVSSHNS